MNDTLSLRGGRGRRFRIAELAALLRFWPPVLEAMRVRRTVRAARHVRPNAELERMFRAFRNATVVRPPD